MKSLVTQDLNRIVSTSVFNKIRWRLILAHGQGLFIVRRKENLMLLRKYTFCLFLIDYGTEVSSGRIQKALEKSAVMGLNDDNITDH
jgi:hypothetical protein